MVKPTSMVDEAVAEMASDFAKCKCVAMAPQCPTPQHGSGQFGLAGKAALSGEGWFSEHFGVGAFWGYWGQGGICTFACAAGETAQSLGVNFAVRSAPRGSYGQFTVGGGGAWGHQWESSSFSLGGPAQAPPPQTSVTGFLMDMSLAWLLHLEDSPGVPTRTSLEFGPMVVMDVTSWGSAIFTANLVLGLALP